MNEIVIAGAIWKLLGLVTFELLSIKVDNTLEIDV